MMNFFPMSGICTWVTAPLHPDSHRKTKEETMTDHTPTEAIKKLAVWAACQSDESRGIEAAEEIFDRWFAEEIRKAKAQGWAEGYRSGHSRAMRRMSDEPQVPPATNPYTEEP